MFGLPKLKTGIFLDCAILIASPVPPTVSPLGVQQITAFDGDVNDFFGYSVAIDDTVIIVSSYLDDDNGINSGSAYVYRYNGTNWQLDQKLTASNGSSG